VEFQNNRKENGPELHETVSNKNSFLVTVELKGDKGTMFESAKIII
jgi:hypothetical protein